MNVNVTKKAYVPQKCHKYQVYLSPSDVFFQALNAPKFVFGRGSALDPAWGAYDAPQTL